MAAFPRPFPTGSVPKASGGEGIFFDEVLGEGTPIWIDTDLRERLPYIRSIVVGFRFPFLALTADAQDEGGQISREHWSSETQLLVVSARSLPIFDMYCHPEWLDARSRAIYYRWQAENERRQAGNENEGTRTASQDSRTASKVMLKEAWIRKCLSAGKFLVRPRPTISALC